MAQGHYPLNGNTHPTGNPSFPDMEEATLKYWDEHDIFAKSVNERAAGNRGDNEFVFYDGPPFANGLPHYGHLLNRLYQGHRRPLPDDAGASSGATLRMGYTRPARRTGSTASARYRRRLRNHQTRRTGHRKVQR